MSNINSALNILEGNPKRLLWLPSVTLAYISTISGYEGHFVLAILSTGGARFIFDLFGSLRELEEKDDLEGQLSAIIRYYYSQKMGHLTKILVVIYAASIVYSVYALFFRYFTFQNPILVGLSVVYGSVMVIVTMNLANNSSVDVTDALSSEPVDDDEADGEQTDVSRKED